MSLGKGRAQATGPLRHPGTLLLQTPVVVDPGFSFQGGTAGAKALSDYVSRAPPSRGWGSHLDFRFGNCLGDLACPCVYEKTRNPSPFPFPIAPLSPSDNIYKPASERLRIFLEMTKQIVLGACHSCEVILKRNSVQRESFTNAEERQLRPLDLSSFTMS